jgi:hypothetical protein
MRPLLMKMRHIRFHHPSQRIQMGYLPGQGCGYVMMINSGSFIARYRITNLVRDYLRPQLIPPPMPPVVPVCDQLKQHYARYYQNISPVMTSWSWR